MVCSPRIPLFLQAFECTILLPLSLRICEAIVVDPYLYEKILMQRVNKFLKSSTLIALVVASIGAEAATSSSL